LIQARSLSLAVVCTLAALLAVSSRASAAPPDAKPPAGAPASAGPAPAASPDPAADYAKLVKGAETQTGLFKIIRKDGKVFLELRADQLDTDFVEHVVPANGLGGFGLHGGDQFAQEARIVRFHQNGKALVMIWPHTRFLATPGTSQATAVHESTADSVQALLPIVIDDTPAKTLVVDASPLLGDELDLGNALSDADDSERNPQGSYHLDASRTFFGPSKAFPQNVILEADQTFASSKPQAIDTVPDARSIQMRIKYNFAAISATPGYMPRLYDERVGFWEDPHIAFDENNQRDNHVWYILRWDLEKSDPAKAASPAKKPIVFYLDGSIPPEYRDIVRDGVLEWNKAFARVGILDALQVKDPPNDPSWDPDDIRYSVIRWVTDEESEFGAEAQLVWDPRTGEIFRGGVLLDSALGRAAKFSERNLLAALAVPGSTDAIVQQAAPSRPSFAHGELPFGIGEAAEAAFGSTALALAGAAPSDVDAFVRERIKSVVMHEVGHDFGLSHNFIAHNAFTSSELKSKAFTRAHGTSASVMDYWPVNIWPRGESTGDYSPQTIGPYDYHAIHWGYAPIPGAKSPRDEVPTLERWASAAVDPRYAFAGDEDGFFDGHAIDPRTAPFVATNHPIDWCVGQLQFTQGLFRTLDRRFPQPQHPWDDERAAFLSLFTRYKTCATTMTHYVAGEYLSRARVGDAGADAALSAVPRSEEKRAFEILNAYVFQDSAWQFSRATLNRLTYTEYMPFANFGYDPVPRHDVPVVELIGALQNGVLGYMYSPLVLQRLADLPTKTPPGRTMTLADLFSWTQGAVFTDVAAPRSQIRRNLQRRYARLLGTLVTAPAAGTPLDAQALARYELIALDASVAHALAARGVDLQTRAHLTGIRVDVRRALSAQSVLPAGVQVAS
jgi:hypothetical protein